ncbi:glycosyltransferase [Aminobacter anthyllidis]|uniref:Glycosyltransferase n=1 Tax=Aminobacter anthyllidis TaxID=1035067 RepID=A0A9X1ADP7_9HYPH|nr:glycosyltransferase [Aminobacter anthyllidis]MBT1157917.1 glycosyltransferase [Aminobacter anthyllidis]
MKVCFVVDKFPSLSETFVLDQISGCLERGIEVGVVCNETTFGKERNIDDPRWRNLPGGIEQWWGALGLLRPSLRRWSGRLWDKASTALDIAFAGKLEKYDVIVAHFGNNGLRVARAMKQRRLTAPLVTIFHGHDVGAPMHDGTLSRYEVVFQQGALQLPVNGFFRDALIKAGAEADTVAVHHMGVNTEAIGFRGAKHGSDPLALISVCRLTEKKGIEFALRALAGMQAARPEIDWSYTVIGGGELLDAMKQLAAELGISGRVAFLGPRPHAEVKQRLSEAHVFVLPSVRAGDGDLEGIPVALMEAMAAGLTVVSTYHSGIPELVEDGKTGLLAPERDVAALAQKLVWIADNPGACESLAVAARRKVEEDFDSVRLNDAFADTLYRLAATKVAA